MADLTHAEQIDTEEVERIFAQRLASGEPTQRRRSLKFLKDYIYEQSNKGRLEFLLSLSFANLSRIHSIASIICRSDGKRIPGAVERGPTLHSLDAG